MGSRQVVMQPITTILLGLLVLGPSSLLALQCYQTTAASLTDIQQSLKTCTAPDDKFCFIAGLKSDSTALRTCIGTKTHSGCLTVPTGQTSCFCDTDGCNENYEKASGRIDFIDGRLSLILT